MHTFSVILSAYNCEKTIRRAAESVIHQLGESDELIIVDDCSTDQTYDIACSIATADCRVSLFQTPMNSGCLFTRREGVLKARGDKVLFLDADDEYYGHALSALRDTLEQHDADIVHYGTDVWTVEQGVPVLDKKAGAWFKPYNGELVGSEVFVKCYVEQKYKWTLWNKCFDAKLCRKACAFVPNSRLQRGEDAFFFFVISRLARSYYGAKGITLYRYNLGLGHETKEKLEADELAGFVEAKNASEAIQAFALSQREDELLSKGCKNAQFELAKDVASKMRNQLVENALDECFHTFIREWGAPVAIAALAAIYGDNITSFAKHVTFSDARCLQPGDTIATYYFKLYGGGTEAVQRMLVKVWRSLGFNVVLLMSQDPDKELVSGLGVDYRVIPEFKKANCYERMIALEQAIDELDIKGIVYHDWVSPGLFWDMTLFKKRELPFFIHCHAPFTFAMMKGSLYFSQMPSIFVHADGVVTLNKMDALYWSKFNPRTYVTVNPSCFTVDCARAEAPIPDKRVLWLARVSPEKRPEDALEIFAQVLKLVPDAKMDFVGGSTSPVYENQVFNHARALGIQHAVNLVGWSTEKKRYFNRARVFLMTSEPFEGYPLTLGEAHANGVPCVMYDLSYLTLVQESGGITTVPFGDKHAAAERIAEVLEDDGLFLTMRRNALDLAARLEEFDFEGFWSNVFIDQDAPHYDFDERIDVITWETVFRSYDTGIKNKENIVKDLRLQLSKQKRICNRKQNEVNRLKRRIAALKKSSSWIVGRSITMLPRKTKKIFGPKKRPSSKGTMTAKQRAQKLGEQTGLERGLIEGKMQGYQEEAARIAANLRELGIDEEAIRIILS